MSARDDEIRRVVAELDVHVAEVEARLAVLASRALPARSDQRGQDQGECGSRREATTHGFLRTGNFGEFTGTTGSAR